MTSPRLKAPSCVAPSTSKGADTDSRLIRFAESSCFMASALSGCSCATQRSTTSCGVRLQNKCERARRGVLTTSWVLPNVFVVSTRPRVASHHAQRRLEGALRWRGRHQDTGRRVARLEILLHHVAAHRVTHDDRRTVKPIRDGPDVVGVIADGAGVERFVRCAVAMPTQADRRGAEALVGEEVQEVLVPAP